MHHADDAATVLREAARVLHSGGVLILKEHDCPEQLMEKRYWSTYWDLYHRTFAAIVTPTQPFRLAGTTYRSRRQWRILMQEAGLTPASALVGPQDGYEDRNMRSYFDAFVK